MQYEQQHSLALSLSITTFLVVTVLLTLPAQWNVRGDASSQTTVTLVVTNTTSSVSSSSSSTSTSSATSSSSTSLGTPIAEALPSGHYRHHETRMAEILLEVLLRRGHAPAEHAAAPERPVPSDAIPRYDVFAPLLPAIPQEVWTHIFESPERYLRVQPWPFLETPSVQHTGGVRPHQAKPQASSGSVFENSPTAQGELRGIEDLDPSVYGWKSSASTPWTWEQLLQTTLEKLGLPSAHGEWILWMGFLIMLAILWLFGLSVHDRMMLFFLPPKKRARPCGGKAIASK